VSLFTSVLIANILEEWKRNCLLSLSPSAIHLPSSMPCAVDDPDRLPPLHPPDCLCNMHACMTAASDNSHLRMYGHDYLELL